MPEHLVRRVGLFRNRFLGLLRGGGGLVFTRARSATRLTEAGIAINARLTIGCRAVATPRMTHIKKRRARRENALTHPGYRRTMDFYVAK